MYQSLPNAIINPLGIVYELEPSLPPYTGEFDAHTSLVVCTVRHLPVNANKTLPIQSCVAL